MGMSIEQLIEKSLALPWQERACLALRLWDSMPADFPGRPREDDALVQLIRNRCMEIKGRAAAESKGE